MVLMPFRVALTAPKSPASMPVTCLKGWCVVNLYGHAGPPRPVGHDSFGAPGAHLIGRVEIGPQASVWLNAGLRGDVEPIRIGPRSNVLDGTVMHTDAGFPLWVCAG